MCQKFYASPKHAESFPNGAIGYGSGSPFDCLGPFAKVQNCPIHGHDGLRLTCYATGHADTWFSIPACTRYRGKYVAGYFTVEDGNVKFRPMDRHADRLSS
jgi:hypothetical protein